MKTWRFIAYEVFDGAMNMAVDEAILESHLQGLAPPTVRLYGWAPPAITIGYAQKIKPDVMERAREQGVDVVRRPTGGRAVLHADELTYSFVGSSDSSTADGVLHPSILGAYKQICQGLILALQELGVSTELGASDSSYRQLQDCFLATTTADLHYEGKKMVGSAQCRRGSGVLQHGSILLNQDQFVMPGLLTGQVLGDKSAPARHANLYDVLGRQIAIEELSEAIKYGFEKAFDCEFAAASLSQLELETARELRSKFVVQDDLEIAVER